MRKRLLLAVAVLVALALLVVGIQWWQSLRMSEFERAISLAPADAQRLTYTDWAAARRQLDVDLDIDSLGDEVDQFLAEAFEEDLSPMSALLESTPAMHDRYPFSPVTLDWELLSQSEEGAVVLMRLPEGTDFDALADGIERLGYQRPDDEGTSGWGASTCCRRSASSPRSCSTSPWTPTSGWSCPPTPRTTCARPWRP